MRTMLVVALFMRLVSGGGEQRRPSALLGRGTFARLSVALPAASLLSAGLALPQPASALIRGSPATNMDAAQRGVVGLYISMADCEVCIKDLPAACTGVLIGPRLVLSASHCLDLTEGLGGKLTKVVFGTSLLDKEARAVPVERFVLASQYGEPNNDLMLIRLSGPAPSEWRVQPIAPPPPPNGGDVSNEYPELEVFGFGDSVDDDSTYSAGLLQRLRLQAISPVSAPSFLTMVLDKTAGTCSGDSGAAAMATGGASAGKGVVGVLSSNTVPCTGSNGLFVTPAKFREFIRRGAKDLDLPAPVM